MLKKKKKYNAAFSYTSDQVDQIRYCLASYRQRYGLGVPTLYKQIAASLPAYKEEMIPDRQTVREFLKGARQADDKILAYYEFLEEVDGPLVKSMVFGDFMHDMGHIFTAMFMPIYGKTEQEFKRYGQLAEQRYEGIYIAGSDGSFHIDPDYPEVLVLKAIGNVPYMSAAILSIYTDKIIEAIGDRFPELRKAISHFHKTRDLIHDTEAYSRERRKRTEEVLEHLNLACREDRELLLDRFFKRATGAMVCREAASVICLTRKYDNAPCFYTLISNSDQKHSTDPDFFAQGFNSADQVFLAKAKADGDRLVGKVNEEVGRSFVPNEGEIFQKLSLHKVDKFESIFAIFMSNYAF